MFRQNKVHEFVEKYGWEFSNNDFDKLEKFLNKIPDITSIIRKINKLPKRDAEYVIDTISNKRKYKFNEEDVDLVLNYKLNYIKKNKNIGFKYLNLDHLYYAFKPNKDFLKYYVSEYLRIKKEDESGINLASYYDAINKHYKEFNNVFKDLIIEKEDIEKYLYALTPACLCSFFNYTKEHKIPCQIQRFFFITYVNSGGRAFDGLAISEFNDIINFVFTTSYESRQNDVVEKKLSVVRSFKDELRDNWNYLDCLSQLPDDYIMGIFKEDNITYDSNFLNLLKETSISTRHLVVEFIEKVNSHYNDKYYKVLNSEIFNRISSNTIEYSLEEIEKLKEEKLELRNEKLSYIMQCAVLDNEKVTKKALEFIENDNDLKLISTKINCVINIISHMYYNRVSYDEFEKYLEILNNDLSSKSVEEKIDILEAKSNFFEKKDAYKYISKINNETMSLLVNEENRNETTYRFIYNIACNYNDDIVNKIVDEFSKLNDISTKKMFSDFVVDEFFASSDSTRQELLLDLFDDKKVSINFSENTESSISVSPYIHRIVQNSDEPLEFVNKDTGIKIFVKTSKKD